MITAEEVVDRLESLISELGYDVARQETHAWGEPGAQPITALIAPGLRIDVVSYDRDAFPFQVTEGLVAGVDEVLEQRAVVESGVAWEYAEAAISDETEERASAQWVAGQSAHRVFITFAHLDGEAPAEFVDIEAALCHVLSVPRPHRGAWRAV
jgi:hypothetical protein